MGAPLQVVSNSPPSRIAAPHDAEGKCQVAMPAGQPIKRSDSYDESLPHRRTEDAPRFAGHYRSCAKSRTSAIAAKSTKALRLPTRSGARLSRVAPLTAVPGTPTPELDLTGRHVLLFSADGSPSTWRLTGIAHS